MAPRITITLGRYGAAGYEWEAKTSDGEIEQYCRTNGQGEGMFYRDPQTMQWKQSRGLSQFSLPAGPGKLAAARAKIRREVIEQWQSRMATWGAAND